MGRKRTCLSHQIAPEGGRAGCALGLSHRIACLRSHTVASAPPPLLPGDANTGVFKFQVDAPGASYFACSVSGHCAAGMLLTVNATEGGGGGDAGAPQPAADEGVGGKCTDPVTDPATGITSVSCRSPTITLSPGDNIAPNIPLPTAYPAETVVLHTAAAEVVDSTGRSVPLSEVYLHHIFGDIRFIPGEQGVCVCGGGGGGGAAAVSPMPGERTRRRAAPPRPCARAAEGSETRRSTMKDPLPDQYALVVDGKSLQDISKRYMNIHLINTLGVAPEDLKPCIEWCARAAGRQVAALGPRLCACPAHTCPPTPPPTPLPRAQLVPQQRPPHR